MTDGSATDAKEAIAQFFRAVGTSGYDHSIMKSTEVLSASKEETIFSLTVTLELCNSLGNIHGGKETSLRCPGLSRLTMTGALATAIDLFTVSAACSILRTSKLMLKQSAAIVPHSRGPSHPSPARSTEY